MNAAVEADGSVRPLRVALIGAGLMAKSHTLAYTSVPRLFPDLPAQPVLEVLADIDDAHARQAAQRLGFARWTGDWREAVNDPEVDIVDIVTPNATHFEIAMTAIAQGKHVYCEKPLALTAAEAKQMWVAARAAGVRTIVGFTYLGYPGVQLIRQLVDDGTLGEIWSVKSHFILDANADPRLPRTWHYERAKAGFGAWGDVGSHVVALVEAVAGPIARVFAEFSTVVPLRPAAAGAASYGTTAAADAPLEPVENDDIAVVLARLESGATATMEANRVGNGHPFDVTLEVLGSRGSARWSQQDSYRVDLYLRDHAASGSNGTMALNVGPADGDYAAFWPLPGITVGLHEVKAVEVRNFLQAIVEGREAYPSFREGWRVLEVLEAGERASAAGHWVDVPNE